MARGLETKCRGAGRNAGGRVVSTGLWSPVPAEWRRAQGARASAGAREGWVGRAGVDFSEEDTARILAWLDNARETANPFFKRGVQGGVWLCDAVSPAVIVKAPARGGMRRRVDLYFLRREFRAYQRLRGVPGVALCHGLLRGEFLVLENVDGVPRHEAVLEGAQRERFFAELFELVCELHRRGVAHGDMQNRNNLLVGGGGHPRLLDFGAAEVWRAGFAPVRHALFRFLCRLDFNVWVKLKYAGRVELASREDRAFYRRSWVERAARRAKEFWKRGAGA